MRFILLLIEQYALVSALLGSVLTYLINLEYLNLKAVPLDRLRSFLKNLEGRVSVIKDWSETLPPAIKEFLTILISFIGIYLIVPFFVDIFSFTAFWWKSLFIRDKASGLLSLETIRMIGLILVVSVAFLLFQLKEKSQLHYAYVEFIVGVAMIKDALEMFNGTNKPSLIDALKFFAAIYVIIRGFTNREEALQAKKK